VSGILYLTASVSAPALLLPGPGHPLVWVVLGTLAIGVSWGVTCLVLVPWERAPRWLSHLSSTMGLVLVATLMAATGGTGSYAHYYLLFVVVFAAYFYPRGEALAFIAGCGVVQALPLLYQHDAIANGILRQLAISIPTYLVAGGALLGGRSVAARLRSRAASLSAQRERVLAQHASMRRVATAVANSAPSHAVFTLVASEALRLLEADSAAVMRYVGDEVELLGSWAPEQPRVPIGARFPLRPESELTWVREIGGPVRTDGYPEGSRHQAALRGFQSCVCAPVWVEQELWGGICVLSHKANRLSPDAEERLMEFGELAASSIANTERQTELIRRMGIDALTRLPNHRAFYERLESEVARAFRHGRPLGLALVDVDHLRQVNEELGHDVGDRVLVELSAILGGLTRKGDLLARTGSDEFAMLLPEADKQAAFVVLDRARQAMARQQLPGLSRVTFTAGICDLATAGGQGSLIRLADAALRWGKRHGRDVCWIYDSKIVDVDQAHELERDFERAPALAGLQALSRAIDAKDRLTREHSDRVASLATRLARVRGWRSERIEMLENAALVHDVGKIGIPDAILLKPGRLEPEEYEVIKQHAPLGAQIVEGVLSSEQVEWVRSHHERPDGRGYPNGLIGSSLSEGAALLAMADAFDSMTVARVYGEPKDVDTAIRECHELAGRQFAREAVKALGIVYEQGALSHR